MASRHQRHRTPLTTDRTGATVPPGVQQVIERALEKDHAKRRQYYPTITKFAQEFAAAIASPAYAPTIPVAPSSNPISQPVRKAIPAVPLYQPPLTPIAVNPVYQQPPTPIAIGATSNRRFSPLLIGLLLFGLLVVVGLSITLLSASNNKNAVVSNRLIPVPTTTPIATTLAAIPTPTPVVFSAKLWTTLTGHTGGVNRVEWSPDGKILASASTEGTVRLWSAEGKSLATLTGHIGYVYSVAWSPDGKILASASWDKTVRLWSPDGKALATLTGQTDRVKSVAWSPDGKTLASASDDSTIRLWEINS